MRIGIELRVSVYSICMFSCIYYMIYRVYIVYIVSIYSKNEIFCKEDKSPLDDTDLNVIVIKEISKEKNAICKR